MRLSIIIPTYKEERAIESTVRQFSSLTIPHEVIVSDGKSPDRTAEIARTCADIVVVFSGEHHTVSIGRNDGAKVAHGEYLAFVDSGVRINDPEEFFRKALHNFKADPQLTCLSVPLYIDPAIATRADRVMLFLLNALFRFMNNILRIGAGSGKFMMMPRAAFERVNGFRADLVTGEDVEMVRRLSRIGRTMFDPTLAIYYPGRREHALGWPKLLFIWSVNTISVMFFNKSVAKEWIPIR